jgi:hypothetical protein
MKRGAEKLAGSEAKAGLKQLSPRSAAGPLNGGPSSPGEGTQSQQLTQCSAAAAAVAVAGGDTGRVGTASSTAVAAAAVLSNSRRASQQPPPSAASQQQQQQQQQMRLSAMRGSDASWAVPQQEQQPWQEAEPTQEQNMQQQQQLRQRQSRMSGSRDGSRDGSGSAAGGSRGATPEKMGLPQRYRQARANQILPIAPEYLAAARAADNLATATDGDGR